MVAAGVLDEHPDLRVLLAHGGGALPALRGRLAHEQTIHPPGRAVRAAIRRFHVDTVVHDAEYRWFVPPSLDGGRPGLTAPDLVIPGPLSEQGSLFRTIHRLRSGLPPTEHLEELTVAPDRAMAALRRFLSTDREHRWVVVAGAALRL